MIGHQRRHDVSSKTISDRASETNLLPAMREVAVTASQERTGAGVATGCHGTEDPCLPLPDNDTKATTRGRGNGSLARQATVPCTIGTPEHAKPLPPAIAATWMPNHYRGRWSRHSVHARPHHFEPTSHAVHHAYNARSVVLPHVPGIRTTSTY
jgi:hypothetical protein